MTLRPLNWIAILPCYKRYGILWAWYLQINESFPCNRIWFLASLCFVIFLRILVLDSNIRGYVSHNRRFTFSTILDILMSILFNTLRPTQHGRQFPNDIFKCISLIEICKFRIRFHFTHWGQMTHICVSKLFILGSDNGLSPGRRQAII